MKPHARMTTHALATLALSCTLSAGQAVGQSQTLEETPKTTEWEIESLDKWAFAQLDSAQWDRELFAQDIQTYDQYREVFQSYPLNKSPFPVALYDYAVSSVPFTLEADGTLFKGVCIGEYENPESEKVIDRLTLLVLTNDAEAEENTLVDSRNYPYLTAQGIFTVKNNTLDWVFSASPDGFSTLMVNMKLFDLRFGETIVIYPQSDQSFFYHQLKDSPNNYPDFEAFKQAILAHPQVKAQLASPNNIR
jgi:hypothetical protein